jgi:cell wall-associated NlpC family hydrolase
MILNSFFILLLALYGPPTGKNDNQKQFRELNSVSIQPLIPASRSNLTDSILNKSYSPERSGASKLTDFAETLKGITYRYGAADPKRGFDCSGFINYVYKQFNINVPRASRDFTNFAKEIKLNEARRGDLILFTGTDSTKRVVGHMGIITSNNGKSHEFIHSTSGKAYGVTVTPLNRYYQGRFVKVIRVLNEDKT